MTTKKSLFILVQLILLNLYSCSIAKKTDKNRFSETNNVKSKRETKADISVSETVKLPKIKAELNIVLSRDNTIARPDEYGENFNSYTEIPDYDINNRPISVWFIKKENKYIGFIVAGHATKAVCEVASLEVHNKLKKIGESESSIFSFGVGHHLLKDGDDSKEYDVILREMKAEFDNLKTKNSEQVSVGEIEYLEYSKYLSLIKSHINLADKSNSWDTHLVEYKLPNFPLIAPFYHIRPTTQIKIKVPKSLFGEIPTELVYESFSKNIQSEIERYNNIIKYNKDIIKEVKKVKGIYSEQPEKGFIYYIFSDSIASKTGIDIIKLIIYKKHPGNWTMSINGVRLPVTLQNVIDVIDDPEEFKNEQDRIELKKWIASSSDFIKGFPQRKKLVLNKIVSENELFENKVTHLHKLKNSIKNTNNNYIIDAFLRGWVFNANDEVLNKQLDDWYRRRTEVWNYILDQVPNSRINSKMAGLFHSDDVFFQIESAGDYFIVTPYKVLGGEFLQVIDKKRGLSYLQSPFSLRFSQN